MKRTLSVLLVIITLVYGKLAYETFSFDLFAKNYMNGSLSDIADEVIAIPLKTSGEHSIEKARNIRQVGNHLFLISNDVLYHFTDKGDFVCQITQPGEIQVAGYVVNQGYHELIVLGNTDDIFYYTYDGELKEKKKLTRNFAAHRLQSFTMFDDKIWTIEEVTHTNEDTMETAIHKRVITYDCQFNPLASKEIVPTNAGSDRWMPDMLSPQLFIEQQTGLVYAFAPVVRPTTLLQDTLSLYISWRKQRVFGVDHSRVPVLPVCLGSRFWISSYHNAENKDESYTFCYDTISRKSYQSKGGLVDDFYQTGLVADLEVMDAFSQSYAFCKSGESLPKALAKKDADVNTVVFIFKLRA